MSKSRYYSQKTWALSFLVAFVTIALIVWLAVWLYARSLGEGLKGTDLFKGLNF